MRVRTFPIVCAAVAWIAITGCDSPKTYSAASSNLNGPAVASTPVVAEGRALAGNPWFILEIGGAKVETPAGARGLFIQFDAPTKSANGFAGCNTFRGSYEISGSSLKFGPFMSTKMACNPVSDALEATMLGALSHIAEYEIKEGELSLTESGGKALLRASAK